MSNEEMNPKVLEAYEALANLRNKLDAVVNELPLTVKTIQVDTLFAMATSHVQAGLQGAGEALKESENEESLR